MDLEFSSEQWRQVTAEDIDRAVNGMISAGPLVKTAAKKTILNRLLHALDTACKINEANSLITLIIYNLHKEMDGQPPLNDLDNRQVKVFNIFVPRGDAGCMANELYIIEDGKIARIAELNIENDLFANRLRDYFASLCRESVNEM